MVMVDIDNKEYMKAKQIIQKDRVRFPTLRAYVSLAVREKNKKEAHNEITNNNKGMA